MSRFINKLAEASGGWEHFLYETLNDVVEKVSQNGFTGEGEDAVEDAREILKAYENEPDQAKSKVSDVDVKVPVKAAEHIKLTDVQIQQPKPKPVVITPRRLRATINVDKEVGGSNGTLPLPMGHLLTNRDHLLILSGDGTLHMGKGEADGQIKGRGVSGHISAEGKFRLRFKEVKLGTATVIFEVVPMPVPKAPPKVESKAPLTEAPVFTPPPENTAMVQLEEQIERKGLDL